MQAATSEQDPVPMQDLSADQHDDANRVWLEQVLLHNYRNYTKAKLVVDPRPVVLIGENGAGKTNFLEALSLFAPGRGLRRAIFSDISKLNGDGGGWTVSARVHSHIGPVTIGSGMRANRAGQAPGQAGERAQRVVRIEGDNRVSSGVLAEYLDVVWLTPAMDGLFTGPASDRRRFLDQLVLCFDSSHRTQLNRFERAMQQRNRLLAERPGEGHTLTGLEQIMAEAGVAIAAARTEAVAALDTVIQNRRDRGGKSTAFPWAEVALSGQLEEALLLQPAVDVEDSYIRTLATMRGRDQAAGRALDGPHRSDFVVAHGTKQMAARLSSTGEQKSLLLGLILAHVELIRQRRGGRSPVLLLDEVAAHLDLHRRAALFEEIGVLQAQAWMTGTDPDAFAALENHAQFFRVEAENIRPLPVN